MSECHELMTFINFLVQAISGALGGNLGGEAFRALTLGRLGDSVAGIIGGVIGGRILQYALGTSTGPLVDNPRNALISLAGGFIGGAAFSALLGWMSNRKKLNQ